MNKFTKPFRGVKDGDIYPTQFQPGDECPPELEAGAESLGALELEEDRDKGEEKSELQSQLETAGIGFDKRWGVDKLRAALATAKKD